MRSTNGQSITCHTSPRVSKELLAICGILIVDLTTSAPETKFIVISSLTFPNGLAMAHSNNHSSKYKSVLLSTNYISRGINAGAYRCTQFYPLIFPVTADPIIELSGFKIVDELSLLYGGRRLSSPSDILG
jgi:hypothetical protein